MCVGGGVPVGACMFWRVGVGERVGGWVYVWVDDGMWVCVSVGVDPPQIAKWPSDFPCDGMCCLEFFVCVT